MRSPLIRHLEYRMKVQHMSNFIIETGKKGSGKSWLGLRIGELMNGENFTMNNVCFSSAAFLDRLEKGMYHPGDVVLLEELGVSANSRDAMTKTNKNLSFISQTIRPAEITLIANTITWGLIDAQVKNMADYRIKVLGHDRLTGLTDFKFLVVTPNDVGERPWEEHLQFGIEKYTSWQLQKPSERVTKLYEPLRHEYLKQLYSGEAISKNSQFGIADAVAKKDNKISAEEYIERGVSCHEQLRNDKGKVVSSLVQLVLKCPARMAPIVTHGINLRFRSLSDTRI